mgnify:CR=1 FL=1
MRRFGVLLGCMFFAACASTEVTRPPPVRASPAMPVAVVTAEPATEHAFNMPLTNPHAQAVRLQADDVLSFVFTTDRDGRIQIRLQIVDTASGLIVSDWRSLVLLQRGNETEVVIPVQRELEIAPGERRILEVRARILHQIPRETLQIRFQPQAVTYSRPPEAEPEPSRRDTNELREF